MLGSILKALTGKPALKRRTSTPKRLARAAVKGARLGAKAGGQGKHGGGQR